MGSPKEVGPRDTTPEGTDNTITAAKNHQDDTSQSSRRGRPHRGNAVVWSQAVSWWSVHEFVAPVLERVGDWPMAGSVEWQQLRDDDPRKWAAVIDGGQHHALRVELAQEARCDASREISDALDWSGLAREISARACFYAERPWLKRVVS